MPMIGPVPPEPTILVNQRAIRLVQERTMQFWVTIEHTVNRRDGDRALSSLGFRIA